VGGGEVGEVSDGLETAVEVYAEELVGGVVGEPQFAVVPAGAFGEF
jgi:hypothetical protein